jgi:hypothetical protein
VIVSVLYRIFRLKCHFYFVPCELFRGSFDWRGGGFIGVLIGTACFVGARFIAPNHAGTHTGRNELRPYDFVFEAKIFPICYAHS